MSRRSVPIELLKVNKTYQLVCPPGGVAIGNNKVYLPKYGQVTLKKIEELDFAVRTGKHYIFSSEVSDNLTFFEVDYGSNWWVMIIV